MAKTKTGALQILRFRSYTALPDSERDRPNLQSQWAHSSSVCAMRSALFSHPILPQIYCARSKLMHSRVTTSALSMAALLAAALAASVAAATATITPTTDPNMNGHCESKIPQTRPRPTRLRRNSAPHSASPLQTTSRRRPRPRPRARPGRSPATSGTTPAAWSTSRSTVRAETLPALSMIKAAGNPAASDRCCAVAPVAPRRRPHHLDLRAGLVDPHRQPAAGRHCEALRREGHG